MQKHCCRSWVKVLAFFLSFGAVSVIAADVPKSIGPQGFLVWETPRELPELSFEDGEGTPLTLADFEGRVVLLNLWATWCVPCREEMPTLDALQAELGSDRFEVVALSIDHAGIGVVRDFYEQLGVENLREYTDPSTRAAGILGASGLPATLLLDSRGREIGRLIGATEWDSRAMVEFIKQAIADSTN